MNELALADRIHLHQISSVPLSETTSFGSQGQTIDYIDCIESAMFGFLDGH